MNPFNAILPLWIVRSRNYSGVNNDDDDDDDSDDHSRNSDNNDTNSSHSHGHISDGNKYFNCDLINHFYCTHFSGNCALLTLKTVFCQGEGTVASTRCSVPERKFHCMQCCWRLSASLQLALLGTASPVCLSTILKHTPRSNHSWKPISFLKYIFQ